MRLPLAVLLLTAAPAAAQLDLDPVAAPARKATKFADVAGYDLRFDPPEAKPGQAVTLRLTVTPKPGGWTYPANPPGGQLSRNEIELPRRGDVIFVGPVADPPGAKSKPSAEAGKTDQYYPTPVTWAFQAVVSPKAAAGAKTVALDGTRLQACNKDNCFYTSLTDPPAAKLTVLAGPPEPVPAEFRAAVDAALAEPASAVPPAASPQPPHGSAAAPPAGGLIQKAPVSPSDHKAALDALAGKVEFSDGVTAAGPAGSGGLATLLLTAAFWGLVSLVTPCVFPMIPITVSLFLKQSHQSTAQVLKLAAVYCVTIVVVLGASAVFLLSVFRELSVDPVMNLFLGGLFVFFALSLFGMYDITLPGFLLRGAEKRRGAGGLVGTVFGALAFSIVSFTCVAPFLGGFAGMTASGNYSQFELILAGVVFATAFASPFFVLALFPSLLKKLPRSGGWLDTVKAVMGFLELAAAFKFFRTAELRLVDRPLYFTYDLSLGAWVAIAGVTGLYLLNLFRLPHDEEKPNVGVLRMLFAVLFLTLAVYLSPALFKGADGQPQRPGGAVYAWVDAFLLPEPVAAGGHELPWATDLPAALAKIRQEKLTAGSAAKPYVFVDFTGVTCTNCKLNEKDVFPQPAVRELLQRYSLVSMYTDEVPAAFYTTPPAGRDRKLEAAHNLDFQRRVFGTEQLPLYAVLEPLASGKVRVVGVYDEGKINDPARFVAFLRGPLDGR